MYLVARVVENVGGGCVRSENRRLGEVVAAALRSTVQRGGRGSAGWREVQSAKAADGLIVKLMSAVWAIVQAEFLLDVGGNRAARCCAVERIMLEFQRQR